MTDESPCKDRADETRLVFFLFFSTHLGLTPFCRSPPRPIREKEGFATHTCVNREMRTVFHDAYMRHQAKILITLVLLLSVL